MDMGPQDSAKTPQTKTFQLEYPVCVHAPMCVVLLLLLNTSPLFEGVLQRDTTRTLECDFVL